MSNSGFLLNVQASSTADNAWLNGVGPSAQGEAAAENYLILKLIMNERACEVYLASTYKNVLPFRNTRIYFACYTHRIAG